MTRFGARFLPVWRVLVEDGVAARVVDAYVSDRPVQEITARFAISTRTLYRLLRVEGIPLRCAGRGRQSDIDDEKRYAIIEAYRAGSPYRSIRAEFGIGGDTLYRILREAGVRLRGTTASHLK